MKHRALFALLVATLASAAVWALSPWLAGHREPWDAASYYYPIGLFISGALAGFVAPRPLWAHYVGAVVGQLGFQILFLRVGALFLLGAVFVLGYSVVFLLGAAIAVGIRQRWPAKP